MGSAAYSGRVKWEILMEQKIDRKLTLLSRLATIVCEDHNVTMGQLLSRHARVASRARHIFVLASTDLDYSNSSVARFLDMDLSFITQVRRRKFELRKSPEYIHAAGYLNLHLQLKDKP